MSGAAGYSSALSLLVLLVVVAVWLLWKRPRDAAGRLRSRGSIRTLEAAALGSRDRLLLVECDGRRYLLSQGVQGVRLIDRLDPPGPDDARSPGMVSP